MSEHAYGVVIPAWNAAATIGECIASIAGQSVPPREIIVVDDGSTDDTAAVAAAAHPLVRVIAQENRGCGAATSAGFAACGFPWLASLDADDVWLPEKIERQFAHLDANPRYAGVCCNMELFRPDGEVLGTREAWSRSTMLLRREVFDTVGEIIDPPGMRGDIVDWLARVREAGFFIAMMPQVLACRRVHPGSLSFGRDEERDRGYLHVARQAILRRRAAARET